MGFAGYMIYTTSKMIQLARLMLRKVVSSIPELDWTVTGRRREPAARARLAVIV